MSEKEEVSASKLSDTPKLPELLRKISIPAVIAFSLIICIIASIAVVLSEPSSRYITSPALKTALTAIIALSIIFFAILPIIYKGRKLDKSLSYAKASSILPGLASLGVAVYTILYGLGASWDLYIAAFALLSGFYFILQPIKSPESLRLLLSFASLAFGIGIIALLYFDFLIELNSHYKLAVQFGAIAFMLDTIAEARATMNRISLGWTMLLKSTSLMLSLLCASLIFTSFTIGHTELPSSYLVLSILYFTNALHIAIEFFVIYSHDLKTVKSIPNDENSPL